MSRISTGTGDAGSTGLADGRRVPKTHPRIELVGSVDEANDLLGLAASLLEEGRGHEDLVGGIRDLQRGLFSVGATAAGSAHGRLAADAVGEVEAWTDRLESSLPPLTNFILPGGSRASAVLQLARSVVRRAERAGWRAREAGEDVGDASLVYLNRLSDLLFVLARETNRRAGKAEPVWATRRG